MSESISPFSIFRKGYLPTTANFNNVGKNLGHLSPPELELSPESVLLKKFFEGYGSSKVNIKMFDHWVDNILPNQIMARKIKIGNETIEITKVDVEKPKARGANRALLTPHIAQEQGYTYAMTISITYKKSGIERTDAIGNIPVMLGSKYCNLHGLTDDEKINLGECPNDPLGYFIINGTPKVITIQEKIRIGMFLTFLDPKGNLETRMTCQTLNETTVTSIVVGKKLQALKIGLRHITQKKHIPLYIAYVIALTPPEHEEKLKNYNYVNELYLDLQTKILNLCKEEQREQVYYALQSSLNKGIIKQSSKLGIVQYIIGKRLKLTDGESYNYTRIYTDIMTDMFSHIVEPRVKCNQLAFMAATIIRYMLGYRQLDDRDSWMNKRLDSPARSMEQLFREKWNNIITDLSISKHSNTDAKKIEIGETFIRSFQPNGWGEGRKRENITDTLKKETPMAIFSQIGRINTPVSRKAKQPSIRMIHQSQIGYICPVETPEGENLGLLKNLSITAIISLDSEYHHGIQTLFNSLCNIKINEDCEVMLNQVIRHSETNHITNRRPFGEFCQQLQTVRQRECILTNMISFDSKEDWIPVLFYGAVYFWFNPAYKVTNARDVLGRQRFFLEELLLRARRKSMLPYDCCIFYNMIDNILEYHCDGGRPCRALLVVENDQLVIDQKNLWNADIDLLLREGAVEFVDAREQDMIMLAMYTHNVRDRYSRRKELDAINKVNSTVLTGYIETASEFVKTQFPFAVEVGVRIAKDLFDYFAKAAIRKEGVSFETGEYINGLKRALTNYYEMLFIKFIELNLRNVPINIEMIKSFAENTSMRYIIDTIDNHKRKNSIDATKLKPHSRQDEITVRTIRTFDFDLDYQKLATDLLDRFKKEFVAIQKAVAYTHSEIDPVAIFGIAGSLEPQPNCGQGPRATYQASMCKQALGFYHYNQHLKFDTGYKALRNPSRPMFETITAESTGLNSAPTGTTAICAFLTLTDNNEDAVVASKEFIEQANLDFVKYITYKTSKNKVGGKEEEFKKPKIKPGESTTRYSALGADGLPMLDHYINPGDAIIGKIRDDNGVEINTSIYAGVGGGGYVDRVIKVINGKNEVVVKVKLRQTRKHVSGDKIASRYAQKGTISRIIPSKDLPRIVGGKNDGLVPDLFLNTCSIPSRMTMGKLKEMKASKAALYSGERVDATCFHPYDFDKWSRILIENDIHEHGDETLMWPSGKIVENVFVAPCYYQALRHHVKDKFQMRSRGAIKPLTHQPVSGRDNEGGLRVGEMERDGLIGHAATGLVLERLMKVSDAYKTVFCRTCGNIAILNVKDKKAKCNVCAIEANIMTRENIDKFVSKEIPYVLKLMFHMLQALSINVTLKFAQTKKTLDPITDKLLSALE